mgnify:CR=1 FL=1
MDLELDIFAHFTTGERQNDYNQTRNRSEEEDIQHQLIDIGIGRALRKEGQRVPGGGDSWWVTPLPHGPSEVRAHYSSITLAREE